MDDVKDNLEPIYKKKGDLRLCKLPCNVMVIDNASIGKSNWANNKAKEIYQRINSIYVQEVNHKHTNSYMFDGETENMRDLKMVFIDLGNA